MYNVLKLIQRGESRMQLDWNFCLSVVTVVIAIIALLQTKQQIKLSNKQHLFDERIENYGIAIGLIQLYEKNRDFFDENEDDKAMLSISYWFELMTNNTYLEQIASVIKNPLKQPDHKEFLVKLEMLSSVATKIELLFNKKEATLLSEFVFCYQKSLMIMYQYQILLDDMKKAAQDHQWTFEECQQKMGEDQQRDQVHTILNALKKAYTMLEQENC